MTHEPNAWDHILYKDGDSDAPACIKDRNGKVVLALCRRCKRGEADLAQECIGHESAFERTIEEAGR